MGVADRLRTIRDRMAAAAERAGRSAEDIVLVGACKRQPLERIRQALDGGLGVLGENIVQEALRHAEALTTDVEWHLIGPLQSNKARKAAAFFSMVHSVDRIKIARVLDAEAERAGRRLTGLLEVNLGGEETKHGFSVTEIAAGLPELAELEHLSLEGLMAIPPPATEPEDSRRWFRSLRELRDALFARSPWSGRAGWLSMGMSADYEVAIEEGATHVRLGSALFGARDG